MLHIQNNAEVAVRDMLRTIGRRAVEETGASEISAEEFMDDGSRIKLNINIDIEAGNAIIDFRSV